MTKYGHKTLSCQKLALILPNSSFKSYLLKPLDETHALVLTDAEQNETLHPLATETRIDPPMKTDVQIACAKEPTHRVRNNDNAPRAECPKSLNKKGRTDSCSWPLKLNVVTIISPS